ncbi:MAG TPA: S24 family peptidase, partial [Alphaproteobacteria bacterium]|nr:S24 family peptidase [Alphaproteobacteria bacterium]
LVISPDSTIRRGDRVVIKTTSGEIFAKELVRQTSGTIELKSIPSVQTNQTFSTSEISWIARIIWVSQ